MRDYENLYQLTVFGLGDTLLEDFHTQTKKKRKGTCAANT